MQLKRRPLKGKPRHPTGEMGPLSASLATATCALLGTASPGAAVAQDIGESDDLAKNDSAIRLFFGAGGLIHKKYCRLEHPRRLNGK